jgi:hypothetical protein
VQSLPQTHEPPAQFWPQTGGVWLSSQNCVKQSPPPVHGPPPQDLPQTPGVPPLVSQKPVKQSPPQTQDAPLPTCPQTPGEPPLSSQKPVVQSLPQTQVPPAQSWPQTGGDWLSSQNCVKQSPPNWQGWPPQRGVGAPVVVDVVVEVVVVEVVVDVVEVVVVVVGPTHRRYPALSFVQTPEQQLTFSRQRSPSCRQTIASAGRRPTAANNPLPTPATRPRSRPRRDVAIFLARSSNRSPSMLAPLPDRASSAPHWRGHGTIVLRHRPIESSRIRPYVRASTHV